MCATIPSALCAVPHLIPRATLLSWLSTFMEQKAESSNDLEFEPRQYTWGSALLPTLLCLLPFKRAGMGMTKIRRPTRKAVRLNEDPVIC